jgi:hypothetical protein
MSLWEDRYLAASAKSRQFNVGEGIVMICNNRCRFQIQPGYNSKFYIEGLAVSTKNGVLHINPQVNILPPTTTTHMKPITQRPPKNKKGEPTQTTLFYSGGFPSGGAQEEAYELIDIFIQAPSKTAIRGKLYPLEVCLVHQSLDKKRHVVACTPMIRSTSPGPPRDPSQRGLYDLLMALANDFPSNNTLGTSETSYSVKFIAEDGRRRSWSPWMFFPRPDKQSFFNWVDPKSGGTVSYILFYNPQGILEVPDVFFDAFMSKLTKGERVIQQQMAAKLPNRPKDVWMYVNENIPPQSIEVRYKCDAYNVPAIEATVSKVAKVKKDMKQKQIEEQKAKVKKCKDEAARTENNYFWGLVMLISLVVFILALVIYGWWSHRKAGGSQTVEPVGTNVVEPSSIELPTVNPT